MADSNQRKGIGCALLFIGSASLFAFVAVRTIEGIIGLFRP